MGVTLLGGAGCPPDRFGPSGGVTRPGRPPAPPHRAGGCGGYPSKRRGLAPPTGSAPAEASPGQENHSRRLWGLPFWAARVAPPTGSAPAEASPDQEDHPRLPPGGCGCGGYASIRRGLPPRPIRPQLRRHPASKQGDRMQTGREIEGRGRGREGWRGEENGELGGKERRNRKGEEGRQQVREGEDISATRKRRTACLSFQADLLLYGVDDGEIKYAARLGAPTCYYF